ncbi:MAG TPA: DNA translocase FtsK [Chloroflexi bacterium]|nr:DNA translocase FtsK [Chloroflexota bacterium]
MREKLEFQSDRIEAVLAINKVQARVTGGTVTPRWVRFQVMPAVGAKISKIKGLSEELAAALDAPNCRVSRQGAAVAVEVPRDDPQPVRLLPLFRQLCEEPVNQITGKPVIPPVTAILGLSEDGAPLLIRLPSPDVAHILVAGTTGSGKTALLQTMILSLAMTNPAPAVGSRGLALVLVDPKGHAFSLFNGLPHLARPVIRDVEEMTEALRSLVRLMEKRGGNGYARERSGDHSRIVVVIDELADLLMVGGKDVQQALTRLTQRGREAGIHVLAATQKPTSRVLGPLVKANFPVRLTGRVTSAEDARTATGWSGTGAERLAGRGDFLAVAEGRVLRFQVAYISAPEIQDVVSIIRDGGWWGEGREMIYDGPTLVPARQTALSRPVSWLTEMFRGAG